MACGWVCFLNSLNRFLERIHETSHFQSSAGRASATADEHQYQGDHPEERSPGNIILCREAAGRNQRNHLECSLPESCWEVCKESVIHDPAGCYSRHDQDKPEEPAKLFIEKQLLYISVQAEIDQGDISRPDKHKYRDNIFYISRMPISDTGVFGGISAGRNRCQGMVYRVI